LNTNIKNAFGISAIIVLLVFSYAAFSYVQTYSKSIYPSSRTFSVDGEGKIVVIPDVAQFTFSVITEGGTDISKLQNDNTAKVNGAIEFIKSNNVDNKDIKTQSYNVEPRYSYFNCPRQLERSESVICPPPSITGYTIRQTVEVKIRDFEKIGAILSGVLEHGANSVSQLSFTVDDPSTLQDRARGMAIENARIKAESIAKAGNFKIGRLLSIQEGNYPIPIYAKAASPNVDGGDFIGPSASPPTVEPGAQEITIKVTLQYEIE
jgi:uncharacterized protein YggE